MKKIKCKFCGKVIMAKDMYLADFYYRQHLMGKHRDLQPTLKEVIEMMEKRGGHLEGKGDGSIKWEDEE